MGIFPPRHRAVVRTEPALIREGGRGRHRRRLPRRRARHWLVLTTAALLFTGFATTSAPGPAAAVPAGSWLSGAAGDGVVTGEIGEWRGRPLDIAGTWADDDESMVELWELQPGAEFGSWDRPLDIALGAFDRGGSWESAAAGAYDARWRQSLTNLRDLWRARSGTVFIRFAHEMNGNWYPWSVNAGNRDAFIEGWRHFRALQREIFPAAQLVFSTNREAVGNGQDWRQAFPGKAYVDVMGVSYYNQGPSIDSAEGWAGTVNQTDGHGGPKGLQQHLDFARSVGLPLAVPEWSGNAAEVDAPAFIQGMHDFFSRNAGSGPGQILYEIQFNVDCDDGQWLLWGPTRMPASAEAYRSLW
jgi:hypothetical protein